MRDMEKTLKDALKIIQAVRVQGDSTERLDLAAKMIIDGMEAEKVNNANLRQQLEEAQNFRFEGMASPAWAMFGEFTKFMEEVMDSDVPRTTSWCIRLEDGEEVTLMNIWAATSHDSPITRATELRDMLEQVLNHSNRPEMDDAQFRMFARENINHLLYGSREGNGG